MAGRLMLQARKGLSSVIQSQRSTSDYVSSKYRPYHMDDFPVPSGSWEEGYRKKQAGHYKMLAFGIVFFISTVIFAKTKTDFFFFNLTPPLPSEVNYQKDDSTSST